MPVGGLAISLGAALRASLGSAFSSALRAALLSALRTAFSSALRAALLSALRTALPLLMSGGAAVIRRELRPCILSRSADRGGGGEGNHGKYGFHFFILLFGGKSRT